MYEMCVKREKKRNDRIKEEDGKKSNHRPKRTEVFSFKVHFFKLAFFFILSSFRDCIVVSIVVFVTVFAFAYICMLCIWSRFIVHFFSLFALKVEYSKHSKLNHI